MAYNKKVMEHFINPRNVGEMEGADGEGKASNSVDGDIVVLRIKIAGNKIVDVKHQVFGCAAAIAGSSAFSEMILGKDIEEALAISKNDVAEYLGGLPGGKINCSILGPEALREALRNYRECRPKTN
jgi:nitrogen fixation protein NifU and related proteins